MVNLNIEQVPNHDGDVFSKAMFGFELLHEKASIFDNHISYLSQCITKKAAITEITSVRNKAQNEVFVCGRVDCDADARLQPKCVMLQGCWQRSLSQNVPLDLDRTKQYSLFPGQVVVVSGTNPRGEKFIVQEVYSDASLPIPELDNTKIFKGAMSLVVASGPYTISDNLSYEPLKDLLSYIAKHKPDVVIMTGPFLDSDHQSVQSNKMTDTFKIFFDKLLDSIAEVINLSPWTRIYITASSKDAFHLNIYPTPAYNSRRKHPNIHFIPDPCTLNFNGLLIGITSTDILMHISQEEISYGAGGDKLSRLAGHVLNQQSYYPLWPPPANLPVDTTLWAAHAHFSHTPHLLILPSNFRYFIKEVKGSVVINPERLTKGIGGGTFARIQLKMDEDTTQITKSIAAQIIRI
ncbi:DNA polymerase alpha subunit B [Eumeta japonica]|uniref:DNA polymerase alpha subunit B n=1 Tax=Eumeta variegata TaxID=151549 RepID=A0A4C1YZE2_EUMVA|nr:DNA polymerase alpha subunit B [Eumeta japonica]